MLGHRIDEALSWIPTKWATVITTQPVEDVRGIAQVEDILENACAVQASAAAKKVCDKPAFLAQADKLFTAAITLGEQYGLDPVKVVGHKRATAMFDACITSGNATSALRLKSVGVACTPLVIDGALNLQSEPSIMLAIVNNAAEVAGALAAETEAEITKAYDDGRVQKTCSSASYVDLGFHDLLFRSNNASLLGAYYAKHPNNKHSNALFWDAKRLGFAFPPALGASMLQPMQPVFG